MKIELSEFEAECTIMKLRGISNKVIAEILQEKRGHEVKEGVVCLAIRRAENRMKSQMDEIKE